MTRAPRFDAAWQRKRRWARWWSSLRWFLLLALLLAGAAWLRGFTAGGEWERIDRRVTVCTDRPGPACVVDGDTLMLGQRRIRLTGFDAPEIAGACEAERLLARRATVALSAWLSQAPFELDGGTDPPRDQYGRELRAARRIGSDDWLADAMIDDGLARDNGWSAGAPDWCG